MDGWLSPGAHVVHQLTHLTGEEGEKSGTLHVTIPPHPDQPVGGGDLLKMPHPELYLLLAEECGTLGLGETCMKNRPGSFSFLIVFQ